MGPDFEDLDLSVLPPEHRAAFEALLVRSARAAELEEIARRQEALIRELRHALHGKRSGKLSEDERQLAFEDLTIAIGEVETARDKASATSRPRPDPVNRKLVQRDEQGENPASIRMRTFPGSRR